MPDSESNIRIQFTLPLGSEGWDRHRNLPSVPREGDTVDFGDGNVGDLYRVHHVMWCPDMPDVDAYVVLRK